MGPRIRTIYTIDPLSHRVNYGVHNFDVNNTLVGVWERIFRVKGPTGLVTVPAPRKAALLSLTPIVDKLLSKMSKIPVLRQTYEQVLSCYSGRRLAIYTQARDSLRRTFLEDRDAWLKFFVKCEKLNFTEKPDAAPRVINPRSPRFNLELATFIKHLEKPTYRAIDQLFNGQRAHGSARLRTVMKGLNADHKGQAMAQLWQQYRDPVAVCLDAKRFDQHVSAEIMRIVEHRYWLGLYQSSAEKALLKRLLTLQLENKGFARCWDGTVKYTVKGKRMSGDMNTSSGNVLLMTVMLYYYLYLGPQAAKLKGYNVRVANDGDDSVLIGERGYEKIVHATLEQDFLGFGFEMDIEMETDVLERIRFCQCHCLEITPGQYRMVRAHPTTMSKDAISTLSIINEASYDGWRKAVGQAGVALTSGVPIYQQYYQTYMSGAEYAKAAVGNEITGAMIMALGMQETAREVHPCCRVSFCKAFGVEPPYQRAVEKRLAALSLRYNPRDQRAVHPLSEEILGCRRDQL